MWGVAKGTDKASLLNGILAYVEQCIYWQKLFYNGELDLTRWIAELHMKLHRERWINYMNAPPPPAPTKLICIVDMFGNFRSSFFLSFSLLFKLLSFLNSKSKQKTHSNTHNEGASEPR